jgi:hypothetical protein
MHRTAAAEVNQALGEQTPSVDSPAPGATTTPQRGGKNFKEAITPAPEKIWDATITTGWESRHIHYGEGVEAHFPPHLEIGLLALIIHGAAASIILKSDFRAARPCRHRQSG